MGEASDAMRPGASQTLTTSGSSQTMPNATSAGVTVVRVLAVTASCYVKFSPAAAPVAATNADLLVAPNVPEYFNVGAGSVKFSVLQGSGAGTVTITEMS